MYGDECDVHLNPTLGICWHRRGRPFPVKAALWNKKVYVFGALNSKTGRITYRIFRRKRAMEFLEFIKNLMRQYRRWKIYLVLDNFTIHNTKAVQDFCRKNRHRLRIVWLPTYSPHLNLIERFWKYLKDCTVRNYFFGDIVKLTQALHSFFKKYHNKRIEQITFIESQSLKVA